MPNEADMNEMRANFGLDSKEPEEASNEENTEEVQEESTEEEQSNITDFDQGLESEEGEEDADESEDEEGSDEEEEGPESSEDDSDEEESEGEEEDELLDNILSEDDPEEESVEALDSKDNKDDEVISKLLGEVNVEIEKTEKILKKAMKDGDVDRQFDANKWLRQLDGKKEKAEAFLENKKKNAFKEKRNASWTKAKGFHKQLANEKSHFFKLAQEYALAHPELNDSYGDWLEIAADAAYGKFMKKNFHKLKKDILAGAGQEKKIVRNLYHESKSGSSKGGSTPQLSKTQKKWARGLGIDEKKLASRQKRQAV